MRVALAQINPTVGDIRHNTTTAVEQVRQARRRNADLVVLPELALFGYPPKDLVLRRSLVEENVNALHRFAETCREITAVVGFVNPAPENARKETYNAAAVCKDGKVAAVYAKRLLPTYDVFDETRYFAPGDKTCVVPVTTAGGDRRIGITVCEDLWNDAQFGGRPVYGLDPVRETINQGIDLLVNIGASPFSAGRQAFREQLFAAQVRDARVPLVAVNQVGGNDDLLFDGAGFVIDADNRIIARAPAFEESLLVADLAKPDPNLVHAYPDKVDAVRRALTLGIRDYLRKCGFTSAIVGLSGGIDSAVTAALAVDALGPDQVLGVAMPSRFSSDHSIDDARQLAANLGCRFELLPIQDIHEAFDSGLHDLFAGTTPGLAEENVQARIRGNLLMALSNKFGSILLTTGNKSELAVGYCTIYGDMCGGLGVLSDVPKTVVYQLAERINQDARTPRIPLNTIEKPPSAELRPDQRDQDSLPEYAVLDEILQRYVEEERSPDSIIRDGFDAQTVHDIVAKVDRTEYKRQQAATGLRVTSRAFGPGRRIPIAWRYRPLDQPAHSEPATDKTGDGR